MTGDNGRQSELFELLERLCEDRIEQHDVERLEQLVRSDRGCLRAYLEYIDLHGTLYWDTAHSGADESTVVPAAAVRDQVGLTVKGPLEGPRERTRGSWLMPAITLACMVVAVAVVATNRDGQPEPEGPETAVVVQVNPPDEEHPTDQESPAPEEPAFDRDPVRLDALTNHVAPDEPPHEAATIPNMVAETDSNTEPAIPVPDDPSTEVVVAVINERLRAGWQSHEIEPAGRADDLEWLRRVSLDIVGHIPSLEHIERFRNNPSPDKRRQMVDELLDDVDYVRNWSSVWANQLIGRTSTRSVRRAALEKYLRDAFNRNVAWDQIVYDFIAAKGTPEDNGATTFLLAHLNNQAVPATAIAAQTFLCVRIQCTQCHKHPSNDWKQEQFWTFNSFFKQTKRQRVDRTNNDGVRYELVSLRVGGPTYYEKLNQEMAVAYPQFGGVEISDEPDVDRREELARLMINGDRPQIASAMINRLWAHFLGYGFTTPVDDMGPHNPATDQALLDYLATAFVRSGYDLKQVIRWICASDAYQFSSVPGSDDSVDRPEFGDRPLFSRAYTRPMSAEQVYDSYLVATQADRAPGFDWSRADEVRHEWIQQFVFAHDTEENDESTTFDGTIPQALMMMNGDLVTRALSGERGTLIHKVVSGRGTDRDRISTLSLASLGRLPTDAEIAVFRRHLRKAAGAGRTNGLTESLQDIFWAYLNSTEFVVIP